MYTIAEGQSLLINLDYTNSGNLIQTDEGIVDKAVVVLDGTVGNYLSSPDVSELQITGSLSLVLKLALADWTPTADQNLLFKWGASGERGYGLGVKSTGGLFLALSDDGTSQEFPESDSATGLTNSESNWIGLVYDVGATTARFFTGGTGDVPVWSQLGADISSATSSSVHPSSAALTIGSAATTDGPAAGVFEYAGVYSGINDGSEPGLGTLVWEADVSDLANLNGRDAATSSTGHIVEKNGTVDVVPTAWVGESAPTATFDGTNDFETIADEAAFDITGDLCIIAKATVDWATTSNDLTLLSKWEETGNQRSFQFYTTNTGQLRFIASDGTSSTVDETSGLHGLSDDTSQWVSVSLDVDDSSGNHIVSWWLGGNGSVPVWSLESADTTAGASPTILGGTADLIIGAINSGASQNLEGSIDYVALYSGIGDNSAPGLGTKVFERTQVDLARAASAEVQDSDTYKSDSGHTVTSSGDITYAGLAPLVIPADMDAVFIWSGIIGDQTGAFPWMGLVGNSGNTDAKFGFFREDSTDTFRSEAEEEGGVGGQTAATAFEPNDLIAIAGWIDRASDLLRAYLVDADGNFSAAGSVSIAAVSAISPLDGITSLLSLPGAMSGIAFDVDTPGTFTAENIEDLILGMLGNTGTTPIYSNDYPDFNQINEVKNPLSRRSRAHYLSPVSSVELNKTHNNHVYDIEVLYAKMESIETLINDNLNGVKNTESLVTLIEDVSDINK